MSERTALVIGATGEIGRAVVARLAADGLSVTTTRRDVAEAEGEIGGVDLSGREGVERCVAGLAATGRSPDVLVALAAAPARGSLPDFSDADLAAAMYVKAWGPALLAEALCPAMAERGFGRVVLATGITGREPVAGYLVGAAVNAAGRVLAKGLSARWAPHGVTVNALSPGPVESRRLDAVRGVTGADVRSPFMRGPEGMPAGRYLSPSEIAGAIAFLCGDAGAGVNGIELLVDGSATVGL